MPVKVKIPTQLRAATDGEATASVQGSTVGEVLDALYDRYGELRSRIAEDGGLRRFVNVYVGGEDIRFLDGLDTAVEAGGEVTILPAGAGGRWTGRFGAGPPRSFAARSGDRDRSLGPTTVQKRPHVAVNVLGAVP